MAFELHHTPFPGIAGSTIPATAVGAPVKLGAGEREVAPVGSSNESVFGVTHAGATRGDAVAVHLPGETVKARAAATILGGATAIYSVASAGYLTGTAGSGLQAVGNNVSGAAAPGETFSLYIRPGGIA